MEWAELDFNAREWRIPASKMKMREEHIVPLAHQNIDILTKLEPVTRHSDFVFPPIRTASRPMSENTITGALRRPLRQRRNDRSRIQSHAIHPAQ